MMRQKGTHAVTGGFGYSGRYIAKRLLDAGHDVMTLTNSFNRENPFNGRVKVAPFNFDSPEKLVESLKGVSVLYTNYWVRFNHSSFKFNDAVRNNITLFDAAKEAGVKRIVYVSITNPSKESKLEYFNGKAVLEEHLINSGVSYAILRPTVIFGKEDILINNIAWALRRFPVFFTFGYGDYRLQPIYVDDLAKMAVEEGANDEDVIIDAIGPETFTFRELVESIGAIIEHKRLIVPVPHKLAYLAGLVIGRLIGDVFVTYDEVMGLMADLLYVDSPPTGSTKLTEWVEQHADTLGRNYHSELARRQDRLMAY
jgi:NADH dehydrogenase